MYLQVIQALSENMGVYRIHICTSNKKTIILLNFCMRKIYVQLSFIQLDSSSSTDLHIYLCNYSFIYLFIYMYVCIYLFVCLFIYLFIYL